MNSGVPIQSAVSVDAVALRRTDTGVEVLTHRRATEPYAGRQALPGVLLGAGERITEAAIRALGKPGVGLAPADALAAGQLVVFDEPHRDPRGPTLSIAAWVVVDPGAQVSDPGAATWSSWESVPQLAFDHDRILDDVRPVLVAKLWTDLHFTAALTGPHFGVRTALAITESLSGVEVDRGNLNRTLKRVAVRAQEPLRTGAGGRPGAVWSWPSSAGG